ncbi:hypothetical protein MUK42_34322, partial [Musa troglodytarum]
AGEFSGVVQCKVNSRRNTNANNRIKKAMIFWTVFGHFE